jgi:hypothetical protein
VTDPHRAGAEVGYYPGDVNFRAADVITINKVNTAPEVCSPLLLRRGCPSTDSLTIAKYKAQEEAP